MPLSEGQVQVRDLVMGEGTQYSIQGDFNPWSRAVRADQGDARAWGDGAWSGAEWAEEAVVPIPVLVQATSGDTSGWVTAHQQLLAAFAPSSEDTELRWRLGGVEYVMFGRPRMVEPRTGLIGLGMAHTRCAFTALDPTIYSGDEHSSSVGMPSVSGGLSIPSPTPMNANSSMESGTTGWTGNGATLAASTAQAHDGTSSLLITPDGVASSGGANASTRVAVTAGLEYTASLWARPTTSPVTLGPAVDWYTATSGGSFISSSIVTGVSAAVGAWTRVRGTVTAPATAAGAVIRARHSGTPAASATWHADEVELLDRVTGLVVPATVGATVTSGRITVTNSGTKDVGLQLRIDGPVDEPRVSLVTSTGTTTLRMYLTVESGQWLDIDTANRTVYLNGTASRRGQAAGGWPILPAGETAELLFDGNTYEVAALLTATWRDAWH